MEKIYCKIIENKIFISFYFYETTMPFQAVIEDRAKRRASKCLDFGEKIS